MIWPVLLSPLTRYAAVIAAAIGLLFGAYAYGKSAARQEAREQALQEYADTLERIADDPHIDLSDDAAVLRELCRLADIRDCPVPSDGD